MGGASGYVNGRFAAASQISSHQRWRPFFADAGIRCWNASSSRIRTSCSDQLADSVIPCSHPASIQRASLKEQISWHFCKCRVVIVRHAGLPCTLMTLTLSVCHASGNPTLTLGIYVVKVYEAAIAAFHALVAGRSVGRDEWILCVLVQSHHGTYLPY